MNRIALAGACLVLSAVSAQAQYVDGLPAATSVSSSDLMPVIQGSKPVVGAGFLPGSGVARRATVGQIANAVGNSYVPYSGASSAVNLGAFPLTLGVSSAPTAPGSGGALYVSSGNVLHYLAPAINGSALTAPGLATGIVTTTTPNAQPLNNFVYVENQTGGTPGDVVANVRVQTNVNGNVGNYAWGINSILNSTATSGQHVAVAASSYKLTGGTAPLWAGLDQVTDELGGTSTADGSMIGREIDLSANGNDDFGSGIRVFVDLVGSKYGTGAAATFGYGLRMGAGAGNTLNRGVTINGTIGVAAIDTSGATMSGSAVAIQLGATQKIDLGGAWQALSNTGVLIFQKSGVSQLQDDGSGLTVSGYVRFGSYAYAGLPATGTAGRQVFCSDCLKPGESAGSGTGMLVFDDGHSHWVSTAGTVAAH